MASLKDIKTRINSVKSTQKITNAMKLVSAAKFARASHAIQAARPYSEAFDRMVLNLVGAAGSNEELSSPLLAQRPEKKILVVLITTDRGLCGGLNANLFKKVRPFIEAKAKEGIAVELLTWGRRGTSYGRRLSFNVAGKRERVLDRPTYDGARDAAHELVEHFTSEKYDRVYLAYARFRSALVQDPVVEQLLPVSVDSSNDQATEDYIVEPGIEQMLDTLLIRRIMGTVYRVFLDGAASEHGARMTAMDSATNNAKEVIRKLTLEYNRARQAAITTELTEIISGAESLN